MNTKAPIRRVCHICGKEFLSIHTREWYCPDCKGEAARRGLERKKEAARNRKRFRKPELPKLQADMNLTQYNRMMRGKGLTYGGKPIERGIYPREPKFLEGVKTRWNKTESGDCGGESR